MPKGYGRPMNKPLRTLAKGARLFTGIEEEAYRKKIVDTIDNRMTKRMWNDVADKEKLIKEIEGKTRKLAPAPEDPITKRTLKNSYPQKRGK